MLAFRHRAFFHHHSVRHAIPPRRLPRRFHCQRVDIHCVDLPRSQLGGGYGQDAAAGAYVQNCGVGTFGDGFGEEFEGQPRALVLAGAECEAGSQVDDYFVGL